MKKLDKHDVVVRHIEEVKAGEHQTTALKIEFEAELEGNDDLDYEQMLQEFLREVQRFGLSERVDDPLSSVQTHYYKAKAPLMFAMFYDDHSVDCELTLTLSLENPRTALLAPDIQRAFLRVCKMNSDYFSTDKAGMHMAFLNSPDCVYPADKIRPYDMVRFNNFRKSMIRLLPALYFLGTPNANTRGLFYRKPQIEVANDHHGYDRMSPKYSAVAFARGSVEFRIFDTCYKNPEILLDNIVVMCKAMRFWTRGYTRNYLKPMPKPVKFGRDDIYALRQLYYTIEHLDLLEAGLNLLKPDYKTIKELKAERAFDLTKAGVRKKIKEARAQATKRYQTYQRQFDWEVIYREQSYIRDSLQNISQGISEYGMPDVADKDKVMAKIEREAKQYARQYEKDRRVPCRKYIQSIVDESFPRGGGNWELEGGI